MAAPPPKGAFGRPPPPRRPSRDGAPSDAEAAATDLARVKQEEIALLTSLAAARSGAATSGAALQAADEARLREAAGARRAALDAVREECAALTARCARLRLDEADAGAGRGPPGAAAARVVALRARVAAGEATLDGDATRQKLYTLLEERTRCDEKGGRAGGGQSRPATDTPFVLSLSPAATTTPASPASKPSTRPPTGTRQTAQRWPRFARPRVRRVARPRRGRCGPRRRPPKRARRGGGAWPTASARSAEKEGEGAGFGVGRLSSHPRPSIPLPL